MAYESISNIEKPPFFQTLFSEGDVSENVFSFVLGDTDEGELYLGGYDESKISTPVYYTPVVAQAYWTVKGNIGANNKTVAKSQNFIVECVRPPFTALRQS
jgi:cathepsin D